MTSYILWDAENRQVETYAGPCRLAKMDGLPAGWGIERFHDTVSQGTVSLDDVRQHAAQVKPEPVRPEIRIRTMGGSWDGDAC
jgi:hypothetical protein